MLYTVVLFRTLAVVDTDESTNEIAGDTAYPVECNVVAVFLTSAVRAGLADDTCVSAAWVTVNRVVDSAVADA